MSTKMNITMLVKVRMLFENRPLYEQSRFEIFSNHLCESLPSLGVLGRMALNARDLHRLYH